MGSSISPSAEAEQTDEQLYQEITKVGVLSFVLVLSGHACSGFHVWCNGTANCFLCPLQANVICIVYSVNNKKSIEKVTWECLQSRLTQNRLFISSMLWQLSCLALTF